MREEAAPMLGRVPVVAGASRYRVRRLIMQSVVYLLLILTALIAVIPFLWMVTTSLKTQQEASTYPPTILPTVPQWHDYVEVFSVVPLLTYFRNTVFYVVAVTAGQLFFCSTAAFAFARLKFLGRDVLFVLYLATLMIPLTVTIIPSFIIMRWFG